MKNRYFTSLVAALSFVAASAQDVPTVITTQPEGTVYNLCRSTKGFESYFGNAMDHASHGNWQKMVFANDGTVYLQNPLNSLYTNTWIKGRLDGDDAIVFDLPQAFYSEEFNGVTNYGYLYKLVPQTSGTRTTYVVDNDTQQLRYTWRDNTLTLDDGMVAGMCLESGSWTGYGEVSSVSKLVDNNTTKPSATATVSDGLMLYMDLQDQSQLYPVKYAIDGNDVYLGDLSQNVKGYWIKGTMKNNEVTFPSTSLVGIDTITVSYVYASAVDYATAKTIYGDDYDSTYVTKEPLVFTYDPSARTLSTRQYLGIHKSDGVDEPLRSSDVFDIYRYAMVSPWQSEPGIPMPPIFSGYMPFDGVYGGVEFKLSFYSQDAKYLDPANLFYCFYIDGELQTFTPEAYINVAKDMSRVPFSFYDQYDFYKLGENDRRLYFYTEPKEKLGIEAVYVYEDDSEEICLSSGITEYYINGESGIELNTADEKRVTSVTYTDLSGQRVSRPTKGIYVRTVKFADGKTQSKKVVY